MDFNFNAFQNKLNDQNEKQRKVTQQPIFIDKNMQSTNKNSVDRSSFNEVG